jgi:ankyrin repeat protein
VNATTRSFGDEVDVGHFAVRSGQIETLELLIARGLDVDAALHPAAWDAREDILDLLLGHGASIDRAVQNGKPLLNELVRWGQFKQARLLLARGASPNIADERGWTALHQAASRGNRKMIEDLVAAGADVRRRDARSALPRDIVRGARRAELRSVLGEP